MALAGERVEQVGVALLEMNPSSSFSVELFMFPLSPASSPSLSCVVTPGVVTAFAAAAGAVVLVAKLTLTFSSVEVEVTGSCSPDSIVNVFDFFVNTEFVSNASLFSF